MRPTRPEAFDCHYIMYDKLRSDDSDIFNNMGCLKSWLSVSSILPQIGLSSNGEVTSRAGSRSVGVSAYCAATVQGKKTRSRGCT